MMLILWNRWEQSNMGHEDDKIFSWAASEVGGLRFIFGDKLLKIVCRPPEEGFQHICSVQSSSVFICDDKNNVISIFPVISPF